MGGYKKSDTKFLIFAAFSIYGGVVIAWNNTGWLSALVLQRKVEQTG